MSNPGGQLWVNPEGVVNAGDAYGEHAALYDSYLRQLASLRERYGKSWGDDEMGTKFSTKFLAGLDNLEGLIKGVQATLDYVAKGLGDSGRLYRLVDDEATEAGRKMANDFGQHLPPGGNVIRPPDPEGPPVTGLQRLEQEPDHNPETPRKAEPHKLRLARTEPDGEKRLLKKLLPMEQGIRMMRSVIAPHGDDSQPLQGTPFKRAEQPSVIPDISAMSMRSDFRTAHVNGGPLNEGYHLLQFGTFPDGTARLDLNRYEAVLPAGQLTVTTPDGHPIIPDSDVQLFVVKENPNVDPTAPGYQPMYASFAPDGTFIPDGTSTPMTRGINWPWAAR